MRKKLIVGLSATLLIAVSATYLTVSFSEADATAIDWFSGAPSFAKSLDYTDAPANVSVDGCTNTNLAVQRGVTNNYEEACVAPTAMGLMKQINSTSGLVQPQGYNKAYPINFQVGGAPIVIPVKNQASGVFVTSNRNGLGVYLGLFKQISNHFSLNVGVNGISYNVSNQFADEMFRYPDGSQLWFNTNARGFSSNGRYFVSDSELGFIRVNLNDLSMQHFAQKLPLINGSALTSADTAIDDNGKIAAIAYNAPGGWGSPYFKLVDIGSCPDAIPATPSIAPKYNCQTIDVLPKLKQLIPTVAAVYNLRFSNDKTVTFDVTYTAANNSLRYSSYSMTANGQTLRNKQYLALGDSYISGEGAYSYREGTDTARNQCHQSLISYPYLLGASQSSFASAACSGAKARNIIQVGREQVYQVYEGDPSEQEKQNAISSHIPGYISQADFINQDNPEAITISIGGNDIGFGSILERCVHPLKNVQSNVSSNFTCYNTYEDRVEVVNTINGQFQRLRSLYQVMKNDGGAGRRVYVIGYPQIAKVDGNCGTNVQMNATEVRFAHDLVAYLDSVIKRAADEAGVQYVDTHQAFDGHRLCEAAAGHGAMNGFTITKNPAGKRDFKASFHPNQLGHELLANVIAAQTDNLTKPMPTPLPKTNQIGLDLNAVVLQNVVKTGRQIRDIKPAAEFVDSVKPRASAVQFVINSLDYFTKAGSIYKATLHNGVADTVIGNFTADSGGNVTVSTAIPANATLGPQTLHVTGNDVFGGQIDIQQGIFVTEPGDDSDGDGVSDASDSCVLATQSGEDADQDGIDDACDPAIGVPPITSPGGGSEDGIIWWSNAILPISIEATSGP